MKLNKLLFLLGSLFLGAKLTMADVAEGEKLFNANCTSCHAINDKVVGPALKDVDKRHNEAWLIKWIKNSQALVKSGDAEALKIYNEYNQSVMTAFPQFSDDQVKSILAYVKTGGAVATVDNGTATTGSAKTEEGFYSEGLLVGLLIFVSKFVNITSPALIPVQFLDNNGSPIKLIGDPELPLTDNVKLPKYSPGAI